MDSKRWNRSDGHTLSALWLLGLLCGMLALMATVAACTQAEDEAADRDAAEEPEGDVDEGDVDEGDVDEGDVDDGDVDDGPPPPATDIPERLTAVRLTLNFFASSTHAPIFWGLQQRYFAEEGINLQVIPGRGSLFATTDVGTGVSDMGLVDGATAMLAISQGVEVVVVGALYGRNPFGVAVAEDLGVTSFEELEGLRIVMSPGTPQSYLLPAALRTVGLDREAVTIINVAPPAQSPTYVTGEADAVAVPLHSTMPQYMRERPAVALPFADQGLALPGYVLVVARDGDLISETPDTIAAVLRALYRAMAEAGEHRDAAIDALLALNPNDPIHRGDNQQGWDTLFDQMRCSDAQAGHPVGYMPPEEWEAAAPLLAEFAELTGDHDFDRFATNRFFEEYPDNPVSNETC